MAGGVAGSWAARRKELAASAIAAATAGVRRTIHPMDLMIAGSPPARTPYGHFGVDGACDSKRRQSLRTGAKTSMTTAPSAPAVASWGTSPGIT